MQRYTGATEGKPADSSIIAIVDLIEKEGKYTYRKDIDG